ncbi:MAG: hypothetical protein ABF804_00970 [Liquorilactobacillus ghanensis]
MEVLATFEDAKANAIALTLIMTAKLNQRVHAREPRIIILF